MAAESARIEGAPPAQGRGRGRAAAIALGWVTLALAGATAVQAARELQSVLWPPAGSGSAPRRVAAVAGAAAPSSETRRLHGAAGLLAAAVLADSAIEHWRGGFENPGMVAPLVTSSLALLAGARGAAGAAGAAPVLAPARRQDRQGWQGGAYAAAAAVGVAGTAFHVYNLLRRPGGLDWLNLFYGAPLGAPAALSLAGLTGLAANQLAYTGRDGDEVASGAAMPRLLGLPAGRALAALATAGLAGTVGEAGLLHFRGAYHNPFMWLPVTLPPAAAALLARAALPGARASAVRPARAALVVTALLGIGGVGFHAWGVSRAMGGWRNWSQNVIDGPPLPAPPSFSALAAVGLVALALLERAGAGARAGAGSRAGERTAERRATP